MRQDFDCNIVNAGKALARLKGFAEALDGGVQPSVRQEKLWEVVLILEDELSIIENKLDAQQVSQEGKYQSVQDDDPA